MFMMLSSVYKIKVSVKVSNVRNNHQLIKYFIFHFHMTNDLNFLTKGICSPVS